jgi:hypothetical protein
MLLCGSGLNQKASLNTTDINDRSDELRICVYMYVNVECVL